MPTGTVTSWNEDRQFGFINGDDGTQRIFVHRSNLQDGVGSLRYGQRVEYEVALDDERGPRAVDLWCLSPLPSEIREEAVRRSAELDERAAALEAEISERAESLVAKTMADLRERGEDLEAQRAALASAREQIPAEVDKQVQERTVELGVLREELRQQQGELDAVRARLSTDRARFEEDLAAFGEMGGDRVVSLLRQGSDIVVNAPPVPLAMDPLPAGNFADQMAAALAEHGYYTSTDICTDFVLGLIAAVTTGQLLLLTGPTGVGKTSLPAAVASLAGAGSEVVPVRPAWIDPTDLLGFFHPDLGLFQPTPFVESLVAAESYAAANRLFLLTLDEMNLSRIENYAADLLSQLERVRSGQAGAGLKLYAEGLAAHRVAHWQQVLRDAGAAGLPASKAQEAENALRNLKVFPPSLPLPRGLVLLGTMNFDESTHNISPKVIDRSFIVKVAPQQLPEDLPSGAASGRSGVRCTLPLRLVESLVADGDDIADELADLWDQVRAWETDYLVTLGIRLGFRFAAVFKRSMVAAAKLGIPLEIAAGSLTRTKMLPWVHFRTDDDRKVEALRRWAGDDAAKRFHVEDSLQALVRQVDDEGIPVISYRKG